MEEDPYEGIAERYDLFAGGFRERDLEVSRFFSRLLDDNKVSTVLDCACGTGSDLYTLHSLGYKVVGSDLSDSMLGQARRNLSERGVQIPLHKADYRELPHHFHEKFDAVICLSTSIAEMPDDMEALKALISMRSVLRDGGILVLSQGTSDKQWAEKPRFILALDNAEFSRLFVIDYLDWGARYNILDILHKEKTSPLRVWGRNLHILLVDDQRRLLKEAGFKTIDFYGAYNFDLYDKLTSNRLITVARN